PGGYSTVSIMASLPGTFASGCASSSLTRGGGGSAACTPETSEKARNDAVAAQERPTRAASINGALMASPIRSARRLLRQPILQSRRTASGVVARAQRVVVEERPEVAGLRIGHDPTVVAPGAEHALDEIVEAASLGASDLDHPIHRLLDDDVRERRGNVASRDRLHQRRRYTNRGPVEPGVRDPREELEELRRAQDRERHPALLDQRLLRHLGAEVAAVGQPV